METIIDRVVGAAGTYEGTGTGVESGPFDAVVDVRSLLDGMGAEITYVATAADGSTLHAEHTVLAFDMWSGEPTLYVLCAELSGLGVLTSIGASTFSNRAGREGFELQIEIVLADDGLEYVWSWGAPGDELREQTRARVERQ